MTFHSHKIDFNSLPDPSNRFDLIEVIGEGTYGEVYSATDLESQDGKHEV